MPYSFDMWPPDVRQRPRISWIDWRTQLAAGHASSGHERVNSLVMLCVRPSLTISITWPVPGTTAATL